MTLRHVFSQTLQWAPLALIGALANAQGPPIPSRLTLREAVRLAVERNLSLRAAKNEIEMATADLVAAHKRLNPAFTFEMENYPYFRSNPGPFFSNQEFTARFDYEVETHGRRRLRTEAAQGGVAVRESVYRDHARRLRLEVERAFYQVVLAQSSLEVARFVLEQVDQVIELNQVRYQQGDISELELKRIEVERLRFLDDVFQSELALRNGTSTLLTLLDAPDLVQKIEVEGSLEISRDSVEEGLPPGIPLPELKRIAIKNRPDLAAAISEQERVDIQTRLQRAIRSPTLDKRHLQPQSILYCMLQKMVYHALCAMLVHCQQRTILQILIRYQ